MERALTEHEIKVDALVTLILEFRAGARMTTARIAERFGVSQRTAERWVLATQKWVPLVDEVKPAGTPGKVTRVYREARF